MEFSLIEWVIIFFLIGGMFLLEFLNIVVEYMVDLIIDKYYFFVKVVKDVVVGVVCVFVVILCIIGLFIFLLKL